MKNNISPEEFLKNACENQNIAPAYIFVGSDEEAKKRLALNFAKALNCQTEKRASACGKCPACRKIESGSHPDVRLIKLRLTKKRVSIDEIRELKAQVGLKPYEGRKKIFIIDKADFMNQHSANAVLKTLEEPPEDTVIILLSESLDTILGTIVSRCQAVKMAQKEVDLGKPAGSINEELDFALVLLRDALIFKITRDKRLLYNEHGMKDVSRLSESRGVEEFESDIRKLIELKDSIKFNANPKIVQDVFSNTMRRYEDA